MSQYNSEQKLRLLQQIRSQYEQNLFDMKKREHILYGTSFNDPQEYNTAPSKDDSSVQGTFRIRFAIALMLFVIIILLDIEGAKFIGIDSTEVFAAMDADYIAQIEEILK